MTTALFASAGDADSERSPGTPLSRPLTWCCTWDVAQFAPARVPVRQLFRAKHSYSRSRTSCLALWAVGLILAVGFCVRSLQLAYAFGSVIFCTETVKAPQPVVFSTLGTILRVSYALSAHPFLYSSSDCWPRRSAADLVSISIGPAALLFVSFRSAVLFLDPERIHAHEDKIMN